MSARTSKTVAKRIDIQYFSRPHPFRKWRWIASCSAAGLTLAWAIVSFVFGDHTMFHAGSLATAHSMFENDCAKCHTRSWQPFVRLVTLNSRVRSVSEQACSSCHPGPAHQLNQVEDETPDCASCHREHRGRDGLAVVEDFFCTGCHDDLKTQQGPSQRFATTITGFPQTHPEFAAARDDQKDPTPLRFNHQRHLGEIRDASGNIATLDCESCHQQDPQGKYMLPPSYDQNCKQCHPLSFDSARFQINAPHESPGRIRDFLQGRYSEFSARNPDSYQKPISGRPLPNSDPAELNRAAWIEQQVSNAERVLFKSAGGCGFCHTVEESDNELPKVVAPGIPARWMPFSQFSHKSHRFESGATQGRQIQCADCHDATTSTLTSDILMPKLQSCAACHSRAGGARHDCVECHLYHPFRHRVAAEVLTE